MPFCSEKNFDLRVVEKFRAYLVPFWRYSRSKDAKLVENAKNELIGLLGPLITPKRYEIGPKFFHNS